MNSSLVLTLAFCIGIVAGLRSLTAPAVVSCAAHLGWINLHGTPLSFMGTATAALFFTLFALVELTTDKLPKTPSRTTPVPLTVRVVLGALSGAVLCLAGSQSLALGAVLGAIGAVAGALGGRSDSCRRRAADRFPLLTAHSGVDTKQRSSVF
jgi:uncharacterized membrane protein